MGNYAELLKGAGGKKEKTEEYFNSYFTKAAFKDYKIEDGADKDEIKALKILFGSKKDLRTRVENALSYDPFCAEAFLVFYMLSEDVLVYNRFRIYQAEADHYADLTYYQKLSYTRIMDLYIEFLIDISNFTQAIRIQRLMIRLNGNSEKSTNRLSFMYATVEDSEDFYRFYLDSRFDAYDYILLLVTLLKNEERMRAQEVLADMFRNVEYAPYLDHLWDLDLKDERQRNFYQIVEDSYPFIGSVPDFFVFVSEASERSYEGL
ncbi:MAG: hypothetical protein IJI92_04370 [Erysipelotrichaceae bacterium]|nr:hypothetical protein [Erysipelotrichaceae bacterium]